MMEAEIAGGFRSGYAALVGRPNSGKSTLLNRLVQHRLAIVSPRPQTTRRRTLGIVQAPGHQMILLDTPGIIDPAYPLQQALMRTVTDVLGDSDIAVLLLDAAREGAEPPEIPECVRSFAGTRIAVLNKIDLLRRREEMIPLLQSIADSGLFAEVVPVSALTGERIENLVSVLVAHLPEGPPFYPPEQLAEQPERFFAGELIREQVFLRFREEVPYSVEVVIDDFKERAGARDYICATLLVEHESQKGILIGRGGQAIRSLGEASRLAIEDFLGRPVYLELRVKVAPKWRSDEAALRRLGYRP